MSAGRVEEALARAIARRGAWLRGLPESGTDCVRLLSGSVEGAPGITVDRYGPLLLIQTGREPLAPGAVDELAAVVERELGWELAPVWNHRPAYRRGGFERFFATTAAVHDAIGREEGLRFRVDPRHGGLDPLLFLDLRAGRRLARAIAAGRSVLNLFAYTCGLGVAAAAGGAREVVNVDFARSALAYGAMNAGLNGIRGPYFRLVHEDVFPVVRQLAGLAV
ncbi:MAG TPA: class I SAM-dependent methyltransferase, partial [Sandaracinaceae bacterium]